MNKSKKRSTSGSYDLIDKDFSNLRKKEVLPKSRFLRYTIYNKNIDKSEQNQIKK